MGIVGTIGIFWSLSGFILRIIQSSKRIYLKGTNMFVLRQLNNKINTTVVSMSIICIMLFMTISVLSGSLSIKTALDKQLEELTGLEARNTTLGYMQRGGTPTAFDRVLSTKYGTKAMQLAMEGKFGTLAVIKNGKLDSVPLEDVVGNNKKIGAVSGNTAESNQRRVTMDDDLVKTARSVGINLGD